ncbi:alcohol dehydrogenase catalytic domain-containing protein [Amnibacterium sp. CER49]|uniref:alcohol dehydrogenase catalytic domain-containing protein n=1 Tax=Amnibacterium sp. CER49 TaxID=3039161 RepID=UPI0024472A25|nr:alcohol dehydrogenase catalytic domain-containing protein [Amnibacterium sp. CER49]MDH2444921.1 alcohol dehydrogenase catalytic domain-containing protein [Amnibacterium sp. CER49]
MRITGAVLEESGHPSPYRDSRPLTVSELELAAPGSTELLVRIEAAGLCHSDLSVVNGDRPRPVPMLLGHEAAGIVEATGSAVTDVAIGERVVLTFLPRCGECAACRTEGRLPCEPGSAANGAGELLGGGTRLARDGHPVAHHLGASAFATHAVVDRRSIVPVAQDVPPEVAALLGCAVLTGGGAVRNAAAVAPGEPVMVVGLGGVGLAAVLVAVALGHPVVAVDALPAKLEAAVALGADEAYLPDDLRAAGVRAPVVIEAAGSARAFETAFAATAPGGRTVTVGLPNPAARAAIPPLVLTAEARTVVGSYLGSSVPARDVPVYADLWRSGRLPVERLVSDRIGLDDLNGALDVLAQGGALRQLIAF